mgnify:CR=1 FL=1
MKDYSSKKIPLLSRYFFGGSFFEFGCLYYACFCTSWNQTKSINILP